MGIAIFPMLQITQRAEVAAYEAKFRAVAIQTMRGLIAHITRTAKPGSSGAGDLTELSEEEGYDERFAYEIIRYEWRVEAVDLSRDVTTGSDEQDDEFRDEEEEEIRAADEDATIDNRFRARYLRISVTWEFVEDEAEELVVETYLPPLPKDESALGRDDLIPPNDGEG